VIVSNTMGMAHLKIRYIQVTETKLMGCDKGHAVLYELFD